MCLPSHNLQGPQGGPGQVAWRCKPGPAAPRRSLFFVCLHASLVVRVVASIIFHIYTSSVSNCTVFKYYLSSLKKKKQSTAIIWCPRCSGSVDMVVCLQTKLRSFVCFRVQVCEYNGWSLTTICVFFLHPISLVSEYCGRCQYSFF